MATKKEQGTVHETLAAAFLAAQKEFPEIPKDGTATVKGTSKRGTPYEYDYSYATLPAMRKATLPILHKHGLTYRQSHIVADAGNQTVVGELRHAASGEVWVSSITLPAMDRMPAQDWGKVDSYARRYMWQGDLGLTPDDDADAQGTGAPTDPNEEQRPGSESREQALREVAERFVSVATTKTIAKDFFVGVQNLGEARDRMIEYLDNLCGKANWYDYETMFDAARESMVEAIAARSQDDDNTE